MVILLWSYMNNVLHCTEEDFLLNRMLNLVKMLSMLQALEFESFSVDLLGIWYIQNSTVGLATLRALWRGSSSRGARHDKTLMREQPKLTIGRLKELVAQNAPVLFMHPRDAFMPCSVEWFMDHSELWLWAQDQVGPADCCTVHQQLLFA